MDCADPAFWLKLYLCLEAALVVPAGLFALYLILTGRGHMLGGGT